LYFKIFYSLNFTECGVCLVRETILSVYEPSWSQVTRKRLRLTLINKTWTKQNKRYNKKCKTEINYKQVCLFPWKKVPLQWTNLSIQIFSQNYKVHYNFIVFIQSFHSIIQNLQYHRKCY
jgi:hypothetical protein